MATSTANRPSPPRESDGLPETGERLATFDRTRRDGPPEQVRLVLDTFEGHAFIRISTWRQDRERRWWPVRGSQTTCRVRELDQWIAALKKGAQLAGQAASGPHRRPARPEASTPLIDRSADDFDEFSGDQPR